MSNCKHISTTRISSNVPDYFECNDCGKQLYESQITDISRDYSFTYERRGLPTQIISTKASNIDEAVENMHYQMERFGFTKEDIRRELLNG